MISKQCPYAFFAVSGVSGADKTELNLGVS
jgi:hypothetical protein